ncbi:hypothetical protein NTGHW29_150018 [Candidatus Nitrotoga sp. HW29]|nr:hypothetical protein NTGHW29_150018 [Candidatus Nitrotoga sp. HW29]
MTDYDAPLTQDTANKTNTRQKNINEATKTLSSFTAKLTAPTYFEKILEKDRYHYP